jgi:hypothetical protein
MRFAIRPALTGLLLLTAGAAWAQYTPPGGPQERPETRRAALERAVKNARYRLGPVRLAPWIGVQDLAYLANLGGTTAGVDSDLTGTLGAGLRAYLRTGKVTWTAQALPQYVWWRRLSDRRRLNGHYGLGLFGYWNRLSVEATADREEVQQILTPELLQPLTSRDTRGQLNLEAEIARGVFAFAEGAFTRRTHLTGGIGDLVAQRLELLDRKESTERAGVRLRSHGGFSLGLGVERDAVDFHDARELDRSNAGTSPRLEVRWNRPRLYVLADLVATSLKATHGSDFVPYHQVTGEAAVMLHAGRLLEGSLYASRGLGYSLQPDYAYLEDQRVGEALRLKLGRRAWTRAFVETGRDDYTRLHPLVPRRSDHLVSYGGSLEVQLVGAASFTLQATRTRFDSNLPGFDRAITSIGGTLNLVGRR